MNLPVGLLVLAVVATVAAGIAAGDGGAAAAANRDRADAKRVRSRHAAQKIIRPVPDVRHALRVADVDVSPQAHRGPANAKMTKNDRDVGERQQRTHDIATADRRIGVTPMKRRTAQPPASTHHTADDLLQPNRHAPKKPARPVTGADGGLRTPGQASRKSTAQAKLRKQKLPQNKKVKKTAREKDSLRQSALGKIIRPSKTKHKRKNPSRKETSSSDGMMARSPAPAGMPPKPGSVVQPLNHPFLFFSESDIPYLRRQAQTSHAGILAEMKDAVEKILSDEERLVKKYFPPVLQSEFSKRWNEHYGNNLLVLAMYLVLEPGKTDKLFPKVKLYMSRLVAYPSWEVRTVELCY